MPSTPLTPRGEANLDAQAAGAGYPSRSMGTRATRLGGTRRPQGRARDRKRRAVRAGANAGAQGSQARMHRSSGQDRTCLREASACHAVRTAHSARGGEPRRTGDWGGVPIAKRGAPGLRDWEVDAGPQRSQARMHGHLARVHLPPRGYRLPCRPHRSLRAGRRTSTYRRLGRGPHREAWAPGLRDWEVDAGHRAVHEIANAGPLGSRARTQGRRSRRRRCTGIWPGRTCLHEATACHAVHTAHSARGGEPRRTGDWVRGPHREAWGTRATRLGDGRGVIGPSVQLQTRDAGAGGEAGREVAEMCGV